MEMIQFFLTSLARTGIVILQDNISESEDTHFSARSTRRDAQAASRRGYIRRRIISLGFSSLGRVLGVFLDCLERMSLKLLNCGRSKHGRFRQDEPNGG